MIQNLSDLQSATEFELWALEAAVPLVSPGGRELKLDPVTGSVVVRMRQVESVSQGAVDALIAKLYPMLFGAAWKVLDLIVELGLHQAGVPPDRGSEFTIKMKAAQASKAACSPFAGQAVWTALAEVYRTFEEARHSLVHRRAQVAPKTGELVGQNRTGAPLQPITRDEQVAFCHAVQLVAETVLSSGGNPVLLHPRIDARLRGYLGRLARHHSITLGGGTAQQAPIKVLVTLASGTLLDVPALLSRAQQSSPTASGVSTKCIDIVAGDA
ncbi:MAG: hypothetical protein ACJ8AT_03870 [Hyalangium sp.]|uniref:hypothetical protein n=1 Tax=Hyalangium sp. TaxID=2028555 RepID=UPI00389B2CC1